MTRDECLAKWKEFTEATPPEFFSSLSVRNQYRMLSLYWNEISIQRNDTLAVYPLLIKMSAHIMAALNKTNDNYKEFHAHAWDDTITDEEFFNLYKKDTQK